MNTTSLILFNCVGFKYYNRICKLLKVKNCMSLSQVMRDYTKGEFAFLLKINISPSIKINAFYWSAFKYYNSSRQKTEKKFFSICKYVITSSKCDIMNTGFFLVPILHLSTSQYETLNIVDLYVQNN